MSRRIIRSEVEEIGLIGVIKRYGPDPIVRFFVWLPVLVGTIGWLFTFIVFGNFEGENLGKCFALSVIIATAAWALILFVSANLAEDGKINKLFAGFRLYKTYWERNVRGYCLECPTDAMPPLEGESLLKYGVVSRDKAGISEVQTGAIILPLGGWRGKRGWVGGHYPHHSIYVVEEYPGPNTHVKFIYSGDRVTIPLPYAIHMVRAYLSAVGYSTVSRATKRTIQLFEQDQSPAPTQSQTEQ